MLLPLLPKRRRPGVSNAVRIVPFPLSRISPFSPSGPAFAPFIIFVFAPPPPEFPSLRRNGSYVIINHILPGRSRELNSEKNGVSRKGANYETWHHRRNGKGSGPAERPHGGCPYPDPRWHGVLGGPPGGLPRGGGPLRRGQGQRRSLHPNPGGPVPGGRYREYRHCRSSGSPAGHRRLRDLHRCTPTSPWRPWV